MKETVVQFGPNRSLQGVLVQPEEDRRIEDAPIAILLNAGIVHKVGPFRLHVTLARQLAKLGFSVLRIDLSGLGDSAARTGKLDKDQRSILDVQDAMDFLQDKFDMHKFTLIGLCSGAYNAHQTVVEEMKRERDRVVGAVFIDGIVFQTFGFVIRHKVGRLLKPRFWRNAIKRRLNGAGNNHAEADSIAESEFFGGDLDQSVVAEEISNMKERNLQMLFAWTDGFDDVCGVQQFKEMFGFAADEEQVSVKYFPKAEHTFRLTENRNELCTAICEWYQRRFDSVLAN